MSKKEEVTAATTSDTTQLFVRHINLKIDSACVVYDSVFFLLDSGVSKHQLETDYKERLTRFNREITKLVDMATDYHLQSKKSQQEYDLFIEKLAIDSVRKRAEHLKGKGVDWTQDH